MNNLFKFLIGIFLLCRLTAYGSAGALDDLKISAAGASEIDVVMPVPADPEAGEETVSAESKINQAFSRFEDMLQDARLALTNNWSGSAQERQTALKNALEDWETDLELLDAMDVVITRTPRRKELPVFMHAKRGSREDSYCQEHTSVAAFTTARGMFFCDPLLAQDIDSIAQIISHEMVHMLKYRFRGGRALIADAGDDEECVASRIEFLVPISGNSYPEANQYMTDRCEQGEEIKRLYLAVHPETAGLAARVVPGSLVRLDPELMKASANKGDPGSGENELSFSARNGRIECDASYSGDAALRGEGQWLLGSVGEELADYDQSQFVKLVLAPREQTGKSARWELFCKGTAKIPVTPEDFNEAFKRSIILPLKP